MNNPFCYLPTDSHRIALIAGTPASIITYAKLMKLADSIGARVERRGLAIIVCRNSVDCLAGYLGLMRAGVVCLLASDTLPTNQWQTLVDRYRPNFLYTPAESPLAISGKQLAVMGDYRLLANRESAVFQMHDSLALCLSTSGSTGSPKYVRLSYRNIASNAESIAKSLEINQRDRAITTLAMQYSYGLSILHSHLFLGASIVLTDTSLMEGQFWDLMRSQNVTSVGGVPYTYQLLKKLRFERMSLPSLRVLTQAGGKLPTETTREFASWCQSSGRRYYTMYGQTEATARMSVLPHALAFPKAGSIGLAIPGGELHLLEEPNGNRVLDPGVEGELVYSGPNVSLGYAESYNDLKLGDDNRGVLHTGDLATRDNDGFYAIVGRKNRMIKLFGHRINLNDLEQTLSALGVECVCSGTDDKLKIYTQSLQQVTPIISRFFKETGLNPLGIQVLGVTSIPRNESGKVLYSELDAVTEKARHV